MITIWDYVYWSTVLKLIGAAGGILALLGYAIYRRKHPKKKPVYEESKMYKKYFKDMMEDK